MVGDDRLRARVVLDDCREAFAELKAISDQNEFRRRWFGFIALLRGVGHVLDQVDSKKSDLHKLAIEKHWDGDAEIFASFIKSTRDQTIKEYRSGLFSLEDSSRSPMAVHTSAMAYDPGTAMASRELVLRLGAPPLPYAIRGGPYNGRDIWSVIEEAIKYWDECLMKIEREIEG